MHRLLCSCGQAGRGRAAAAVRCIDTDPERQQRIVAQRHATISTFCDSLSMLVLVTLFVGDIDDRD